jgi:hypothetical protein
MVLVVVADDGVVVNVVVVPVGAGRTGAGHVSPPHASQQLGRSPTHTVPRLGARHAVAVRLMMHV